MISDAVHICFISDDAYVLPTLVAIASLVRNKAPESIYRIYVLGRGISPENRLLFTDGFREPGVTVSVIEPPVEDAYEGVTSGNVHVSAAALYKFSLPEIFQELDRLLYLDGDILVEKDLSELWNTELSGYYAAAVKDYRAVVSDPNPLEYLSLKEPCYFNSGVMLLNLALLRQDGVKEKLIDYRLHGKNRFMDQDTLNVVFSGKVRCLPLRFNAMYSTVTFFSMEEMGAFYGAPAYKSMDELCEDAVIVHLCSPTKPWQFHDSWYADEWFGCYQSSPVGARPLMRGYLSLGSGIGTRAYRISRNIIFLSSAGGRKVLWNKIRRKIRKLEWARPKFP